MTRADAKTAKNNNVRTVYTDIATLFSKYERQGEHIIYLRDGFFPVIRADVLLKEKSREQLGDIEKTILGLVGAGLSSLESVALAMGMSAHRLGPLMRELGGRSLIRIENNQLSLRNLGRLSLQYGAEVVEVPRSFLLSGLDGKLLPRTMYIAERVTIAALPDSARRGEILNPARRINLAALDLTDRDNRYEFNIPDEALEVTSLTSHEPLFIRGKLIVSASGAQSHTARFVCGPAEVEIKDATMAADLMEPLGFSSFENKTPENVLKDIVTELVDLGTLRVGRATLDRFGNPEVVVHDVYPPFEAIKSNGLPLLAHLGTRQRRGIPIARFPFQGRPGNDMLKGRTLTLIAGDSALESKSGTLRLAIDSLDQYFQLAKSDRPHSFTEYLNSAFENNDWRVEDVATIARQVEYHRLSKMLTPKEENA